MFSEITDCPFGHPEGYCSVSSLMFYLSECFASDKGPAAKRRGHKKGTVVGRNDQEGQTCQKWQYIKGFLHSPESTLTLSCTFANFQYELPMSVHRTSRYSVRTLPTPACRLINRLRSQKGACVSARVTGWWARYGGKYFPPHSAVLLMSLLSTRRWQPSKTKERPDGSSRDDRFLGSSHLLNILNVCAPRCQYNQNPQSHRFSFFFFLSSF